MKRISWGVILLVCLILILGGSRVAYMGCSVVGLYGNHPEPYYIIALGGSAIALGAMFLVMKWASSTPAP